MVEEFLRDQVLRKSPEERTNRDEQLLEYGRAFADVLYRHESADTSEPAPHEREVTRLMKTANAINREYDLRDLDAEALAELRKGR